MNTQFLPVSQSDMRARGWEEYDFLLITGDAYVDHPSFGPAIIARVLEAEGYRVAVLAQPDWKGPRPLPPGSAPAGVLISAGNIDSMVAHYTVAKSAPRRRLFPGNRPGLRPDRATIVYANRIREVFGDIPVVIGGQRPSLRRFAHYDYWEDKVRRSILFDAQADLLVYGMGGDGHQEIAGRLASGLRYRRSPTCRAPASLPGTRRVRLPMVEVPSFESVSSDKAGLCPGQYD